MTETAATLPLTRPQIRRILRRHRGAAFEISKALGISPVTVSLWLKGKTVSQRIAEAAQAKALELLEKEAACPKA